MGKTQISAPDGLPFIDMTRTFDAPRELVWRAYTEPELMKQWLGPRKYTTTIEEYDVRDGGRWRYLQHDDKGNTFAFHGVFHGVPRPENFTQTFEFEGWPDNVALDTLSLEENDGRTTARTHSVYQSVAARNGMVESGMEDGVNDGFDRLDELLARLSAKAPTGAAR
jgi:uncharacterized protein YndB with AHSA1/START domain